MDGDNPYASLERIATALERIAPALERLAASFDQPAVAEPADAAGCAHTGERLDFGGDDWICRDCGWRQSLYGLIPVEERRAMGIPIRPDSGQGAPK